MYLKFSIAKFFLASLTIMNSIIIEKIFKSIAAIFPKNMIYDPIE